MIQRALLERVPLPSFRRPPVVEVVIGAQMLGPSRYSLEALGTFASSLGDEGLQVQESKPAIQVRPEHLDLRALAVGPSLDVLLGSGHPPVCHVLKSADGNEMVQFQHDWLAVNWRKTSDDAVYPRWPSRWETFHRRAQLAEHCFGGGSRRYGLVEVTYVNHIEVADTRTPHSEAHRVFSFLKPGDALTDGFLRAAEQCQVNLSFLISSPPGRDPVGRLNVSITPGWSAEDKRQILVMTLTARGNFQGDSLEAVQRFADLAREWIVRAFADLTTPQMHAAWGREDIERSS